MIKVFKGFASQEDLKIFTSREVYTCKVNREEILLYEGKFYEVIASLIICLIIIIQCFILKIITNIINLINWYP